MSAASDIRWRDWSRAAFDEAQAQDKPILLRLSATWCHWCHVMDKTSDQEPDAVRLLNEKYVPIRVDIDQFPDVSERYNFGGFPTSAFLTPQGDVITGGTYIPPADFARILGQVEEAYRTHKPDVLERIREADEHEPRHAASPAPDRAEAAARRVVDSVAASLLLQFDVEHGGFGGAPKFPHPSAIELALRLHQDRGESEYAVVVRKTLDAMRAGELWDPVEHGFFRYTTRADWRTPHYEKMLESNAGLLRAYATAAATLDRPEWAALVADHWAYLDRVLRDPRTSLFRGSQDADEEYYQLPDERRRGRAAPSVDPTFYTDWNALVVVALLDAFLATGEFRYRDRALAALESLVRRHFDPREGFFHYSTPRGPPQRADLFSDQVHALWALVRAHEVTGDARWLDSARATFALARNRFWDEPQGRFLDRAPTGEEFGRVRKPRTSVAENGLAVRALVRLGHWAESDTYRRQAATVLASYESEHERWGLFAADLALGALEYLRPPLVVHVAGEASDAQVLLREVCRAPYPHVPVRVLSGPEAAKIAAALGIAGLKPPALFACAGRTCSRLYRPGETFAADLARLGRTSAPA